MPTVPIPSSMIECVVSGISGNGDVWVNVVPLSTTVTVNDALLTNLTTDFSTLYGSLSTLGMFYTGWKAQNVRYRYNDGSGGIAVADKALSISGTITTAAPNQVAIVVSQKTAKSGASFRGRTYLGPLASNLGAADGSILATLRTNIVAKYDTFKAGTAGHSCAPVVWSRKNVSFEPITSYSVGPYFDTQRRRRSALRG